MDCWQRTASWKSFARWLLAGALLLLLPTAGAGGGGRDRAVLPEVTVAELPPEARETIQLIRQGGPFPYERDGIVFGNFEKLLPLKERGYYREYTVRTPGVKGRGARRIVAGKGGELYYTEDHYRTFRRIKEPAP
ncbi:MAG TPA: ribonuclease domain-containing protein [Burkholderiales bacterium]|nr:ribonuclease domain-containing protein [Burkholderiales bacterium]